VNHCPSHEWDAHVNAEDDAFAAEVAFFATHRDAILRVVCAILQNSSVYPIRVDVEARTRAARETVDVAAAVVLEVVHRGEDPYQ
jgi:hypothetical protein